MDQFGSNGIYSPGGMPNPVSMATAGFDQPVQYGMHQHSMPMASPQHPMQGHQHTQSMGDMPPPPARNSVNINDMNDMMMQRLSLGGNDDPRASLKSRLRPSLNTRGSGAAHDLGIQESNLSLMSNFSGVGMGSDINMNVPLDEYSNHMANSQQQLPPPGPPIGSPLDMSSPSMRSFDRRRLFAKMKYSRPASGRFSQHSQHSMGDGMPDIHMVDSNFSLLSNLSSHDNNKARQSVTEGIGRISDHANNRDSMPSEYIGVGSRRSLMSGLSRISDNSEVNSIFSDLSKKIGNVSTRSIAMSEISGIEEGYHEDFSDTFLVDHLTGTSAHTATMDFDS